MSGSSAMNRLDPKPTTQSNAEEDSQNQPDHMLRTILLLVYVLLLMVSLTECVMVIIALKRARRQTLTARLLLWTSLVDTPLVIFMQGSVIVSLPVGRWVFGDTVCLLSGYMIVFLRIAGTLIRVFLAVIRYIALVIPRASRETKLYQAAGASVILVTIIGVGAAACPFLNVPGFVYVDGIFRCDFSWSWAAQMTSIIFIVFPSILIIGLAIFSLKKVREIKGRFGVHMRSRVINCHPHTGDVGMATRRKPQPTISEVRASRGIAITLLFSIIATLLYSACQILAPFVPETARIPLLISSGIICGLCPIIRSTLLVATSPVLRSVLKVCLFQNPEDSEDQTLRQTGFHLIQHSTSALSPRRLDFAHRSVEPPQFRGAAEVQGNSAAPRESLGSKLDEVRRTCMSNISTISCDVSVFHEADRDDCTIFLSGEFDSGRRGNEKLSRITSEGGDSASLVVRLGSSNVDLQKETTKRCSLSDGSAETITPSYFLKHESATDDRKDLNKHEQVVSTRNQSLTSLKNLSPLDVRYISSMKGKKTCHTPSKRTQVNASYPRPQRVSLPVALRPVPQIPRIVLTSNIADDLIPVDVD